RGQAQPRPDARDGQRDDRQGRPGAERGLSSSQIWTTGYTSGELEGAQEKYDLLFPPDLIEVLLEKRPAKSFDWRTDDDYIRSRLAWPLEGILFDIENNEFWLADWGERPRDE